MKLYWKFIALPLLLLLWRGLRLNWVLSQKCASYFSELYFIVRQYVRHTSTNVRHTTANTCASCYCLPKRGPVSRKLVCPSFKASSASLPLRVGSWLVNDELDFEKVHLGAPKNIFLWIKSNPASLGVSFRGSSGHFCFDHFYIVDFHSALTTHWQVSVGKSEGWVNLQWKNCNFSSPKP